MQTLQIVANSGCAWMRSWLRSSATSRPGPASKAEKPASSSPIVKRVLNLAMVIRSQNSMGLFDDRIKERVTIASVIPASGQISRFISCAALSSP